MGGWSARSRWYRGWLFIRTPQHFWHAMKVSERTVRRRLQEYDLRSQCLYGPQLARNCAWMRSNLVTYPNGRLTVWKWAFKVMVRRLLLRVPTSLSELSLRFLGCGRNRPKNNSKFDFRNSKRNRSRHKSAKRQYPVSIYLIYQVWDIFYH